MRSFFLLFLFHALSIYSDAPLHSKIPLVIWQTDKTKELSFAAAEARGSWASLNPEFSLYLFGDEEIEGYIQEKWTSDFLQFFRSLPIGAMKADLWRYLILTTEGGVYSDIDSVCIAPIREWPLRGNTSRRDVLLLDLDANQSQFCQWTFAATPRHPAMEYVCKYLLKQWKKRGLLFNKDGKIDVLGTTGPAFFTKALKSFMEEDEEIPAFKIYKKYINDSKYRKRLNRMGIFFTPKGYFSGGGAKNLFWGSWSREMK